jgi:hypothetical protein
MAKPDLMTVPVDRQTHTLKRGEQVRACGVVVQVLGQGQLRIIVPRGCPIAIEKVDETALQFPVEHTVPQ